MSQREREANQRVVDQVTRATERRLTLEQERDFIQEHGRTPKAGEVDEWFRRGRPSRRPGTGRWVEPKDRM